MSSVELGLVPLDGNLNPIFGLDDTKFDTVGLLQIQHMSSNFYLVKPQKSENPNLFAVASTHFLLFL